MNKYKDFLFLPKQFHVMHEQCWNLVKMIEEFILDKHYYSMNRTEFPISEEMAFQIQNGKNGLDVLETFDEESFQKVITKQIILGIFKDFCYFMQEALSCSLKKRLVVTYALLRRPIIDDMKILLRLCYDEDFFDNFKKREDYDPVLMKDDSLKEYLAALDESRLIQSIKGEDIFAIVFDKMNPNSLVNLTNRAIHPVTTRGINKTGLMNLNFNYMNSEDEMVLWNKLYTTLKVVLLYYFELSNVLVFGLLANQLSDDLLEERYNRVLGIMR